MLNPALIVPEKYIELQGKNAGTLKVKKKTLLMHLLVLLIVENNCMLDILCGIAKLLRYFNNITNRFRNILTILHFQGIFLKYFGAA